MTQGRLITLPYNLKNNNLNEISNVLTCIKAYYIITLLQKEFNFVKYYGMLTTYVFTDDT